MESSNRSCTSEVQSMCKTPCLLQTDDAIPLSKPSNGAFLITIYCCFFAELSPYRGYYYFFLCRFSWAQRRQTASFLPGIIPEKSVFTLSSTGYYCAPLLNIWSESCRRPLGVLHTEHLHAHRSHLHLQTVFCSRQREALKHERSRPMVIGILSRGNEIWIFFRRGRGRCRACTTQARTQAYGTQQGCVVVSFVISVSSSRPRSMQLLYMMEEHSVTGHVAQFSRV
jgi:hypothetical protein